MCKEETKPFNSFSIKIFIGYRNKTNFSDIIFCIMSGKKKKKDKRKMPSCCNAYAGRRWKLSRYSCSNKQYILCLDKMIGTSFHANNAHGIFLLSTLKNQNNVCLKICMANILSFLSVFCSRPAILKNTSHDTRSNLSYMHT